MATAERTGGGAGHLSARRRGGLKVRRDQGITLIELIVAMALFALVAVMGLQALNGMLRSRDRLSDMADETAGLSTARASR